jgi:hypothetical protein
VKNKYNNPNYDPSKDKQASKKRKVRKSRKRKRKAKEVKFSDEEPIES